MQEKLYNMLLQEDEITWKSIIMDLIKTEQMNPWDINISKLSQRYMETIKEMDEHNFFISGKVILAASILLRIKSNRLLTEYIANFDSLLYPPENIEEDIEEFNEYKDFKAPKLLVKTPQARKRKVNLNDLMLALQKALEVDNRRRIRKSYETPIREYKLPKKTSNILDLIKNVYNKISILFQKKETITFSELLPSEKKQDKIDTFIPLLHLQNKDKIDLNQEIPFGEIEIKKPLKEEKDE